MKPLRRWIRDVFGFSANEINGFLILLPIMSLLICSEPAYRWWLVNEDRKYDVSDPALDSAFARWTKTAALTEQQMLFLFDPNTVSEAEMLQLGLNQTSAMRIAAYRQKGGVFRIKSDLRKIYGLDSSLYKQLYCYINLPTERPPVTGREIQNPRSKFTNATGVNETFDMNTADTVLFKTVYGIGSRLAARIVKFRKGLGGFVRTSQLYEVYGLDSAVVERLLKVCFISPDFQPERININQATEYVMTNHPYIRRNFARRIVSYRFQHGDFHDLNDIKKLSVSEDYELERLLPYLKLND